MEAYCEFTKQYQVQKTLRFALIPQQETLEHIQKDGILTSDIQRKTNYTQLKNIIDNVHKKFIDDTLSHVYIDWEPLGKAIQDFRKDKTDDKKRKAVITCQGMARSHIVKWFEGKEGTKDFQNKQQQYFKKLFGKELFSDILVSEEIGLADDELALVESFNKFTTYFTGFHENRKNMYSEEEKSTAVAFRLVNENFPKFLDNCIAYEAMRTILSQQYPVIWENLKKACHALSGEALTLETLFTLSYYNHLLTQQEIEVFNRIIGGMAVQAGKEKVQGLNEILNLAMQQDEGLREVMKSVPHRFEPLYKQILSDKVKLSFLQEEFQTDGEALEAIHSYYQYLQDRGTLQSLKVLFENVSSHNLSQIYVKNVELPAFSLFMTGQWNAVRDILVNQQSEKIGEPLKVSQKNKIDNWVKTTDFSLQEIMEGLAFAGITDSPGTCLDTLIGQIKQVIEAAQHFISLPLPGKMTTFDEKTAVKNGLDAMQQVLHILKFFRVPSEYNRAVDFYNPFDEAYADLESIISLYNKVRNVATRKPYSVEKYKLNFYNPELAGGWDKNKEREYGSILLTKDGKYFLGIFNPYAKPDIETALTQDSVKVYRKMVYKFFPAISKMLPKCTTQLKEVKAHFANSIEPFILSSEKFREPLSITREVYELNNALDDHNKKKFQIDYLRNTQDTQGYYHALHTWIDFAKDFVSKYSSTCIYDFSRLRKTEDYEKLDEFYKDLDNICYQITYENIPEQVIWQWVKQDQLYFFEIYNKDFSAKSTGRPNMHTLYWKCVFDPKNLADIVIKLNGQAELFYRPKSNMPVIEHHPGDKIVNKKNKEGKPIEDAVYREIYLYANGKLNRQDLSEIAKLELSNTVIKTVSHTIVKDKRYTTDAFFFHVPLTLNYQAPAKPQKMNQKVQAFLREHKEVNIIGIDRGERNLIYAVVINQRGEILESRPFNIISQFDYHDKLEQRQEERLKARRSWDTVNKIKDLKEGYLSLVIHEIAQMMIKYHAIVVLENLNTGFKRIRGGIAEKSVYQKFEKMLIDKLNYLAFKDFVLDEPGGILNAYQLTDKFDSFKKMGSQCGFLFYVPAAFTSKIDPVTGFVNVFNLRSIKNRKEQKEFLGKFDRLQFDAKGDGAFILHCNLQNGFKVVLESYLKEWDIRIAGRRIVYDPKEKTYKEIDLVKQLSDVLDSFGIPYRKGEDIIPSIRGAEDDLAHGRLYGGIFNAIKYVLQMRYTNNAEDYILSPVMQDGHAPFDSREADASMPQDGDANGAYHIALKGVYMLRKIRETPKEKMATLTITNKDWLAFAQKKEYKS